MHARIRPPKWTIVMVPVLLVAALALSTSAVDAAPFKSQTVTAATQLAAAAAPVGTSAVVTWGSNDAGQLGNGAAFDSSSASPVPVLSTGALAGKTVSTVSSGTAHACAVASGSAYCWGLNADGQLGNNTKTDSNVPVAVTATGVISGKAVTAISAGYSHTCAIAGGNAYCWGSGADGVLGNGGTTGSSVPVAVAGPLTGKTVTAISAGRSDTCAVSEGRAYCWGYNANGQLGNGTTTDSSVPVAVSIAGVLAGKNVTAISVGAVANTAACAIADSAAYCWGGNTYGAVGDGTTTQRLTPVAISITGAGGPAAVTDISVGGFSTCAVAGGAGYCWGLNEFGELGDNTVVNKSAPVAVNTTGALAGKTLTAISVGSQLTGNAIHPAFGHTCAVASGQPVCWGANQYGQLGVTTASYQSSVPVAVDTTGALAGATVSDVASGAVSSLALTSPSPVPTTPGAVVPLAPSRILDTRPSAGGSGAVPATGSTSLQVLGKGGVPATGVSAVLVNVTVTGAQASGFLTVWPSGTARQSTSSLNFAAGQTIPNLVLVPVGADGKIQVYVGSTGSAQLIVDVAGYVVGGAATSPGAVVPLAPARVLDTRPSSVPALGTTSLQVLGKGGVPATGVSAVLVNVTVTGAQASGFLTVWPSGTARQSTSSLNFVQGESITNLVLVPVGADGKIQMYVGSTGSAQLITDVAGYVIGGPAATPGAVVPLAPSRVMDTRPSSGGSGAVPASGSTSLQVLGRGGVPATGVSAVLVNVTVTGAQASGFITVWPSGAARQLTSNLNFALGQTIPNLVLVPVGADGKIQMYVGSTGSAQLIVDVAGYVKGNS